MCGRQEVNDGRFEEFAGAPVARAYEYPPQFTPNAGHRGLVVTADKNLRICGIRGCAVATLILLLILAIVAPSAPAQVTSVVKLLSTPNPVVHTPVTFTAGVNWTATAPPSGTITLTDTVQCPGTSTATQTTLGTITLGSADSATPGAGTLVVSSFPCAGGNLIVANYSGDSNYSAGVSQPLLQTVLAQFTATSATLSSSLNPSSVGQSVTFTAKLTYTLTNKTYPTGTVTFTDTPTSNVLGTANVQTSSGRQGVVTIASITTSSLAGGSHLIQAAYSGDNIYAPSTSQIVNQVISFGITTGSSLPGGSTGTSYSQTLSASGGMQPYSWSLASGGLPPGLTLSVLGVMIRLPTRSTPFPFTALVTGA